MHPQPGLGAKRLTVDVTGPLRDFVGQGKAVPDGMVVGPASPRLDHYFGPSRERHLIRDSSKRAINFNSSSDQPVPLETLEDFAGGGSGFVTLEDDIGLIRQKRVCDFAADGLASRRPHCGHTQGSVERDVSSDPTAVSGHCSTPFSIIFFDIG